MQVRHAVKSALMLLLGLGLAAFGSCGSEPTWTLVWNDEFDGSAGQAPDPARWRYDVGTGPESNGWGNGQQEFDTARPENVSLDGAGNLVITALKEEYQGMSYTSARLVTQDLFATTYGRFEARMKMPVGQGLWPAFWLLGANVDTVGWPACGEIDVVEYRGQEPRRITGSLHGPGYSGARPITSSYDLPGVASFDQDFHVFAVEWGPDLVTWEVDGVTWQGATPQLVPKGGTWVFAHPFFLILNLAVGGTYVGVVDGTATFPQRLVVDYVRVYKSSP
jgi:beta-glucanase (GH16 family)